MARSQNSGKLDDNVQLWLEYHLLQHTVEDQVEKWAFRPPHENERRDPASMSKARGRIYTQRRRGRKAACEAAKALMRAGTAPEDALLLGRLLGCKKGEGPKC